MTIQERISDDLKVAMRNKESEKRDFLKLVKSEMQRGDKLVIDDKEAMKVLQKMKKDATLMSNEFELSVLANYLPKVLDEAETRTAIQTIITENGFTSMKDMGSTMKKIKEIHGTTIDGRLGSTIVKEILNS